MNMSSISRTS